MPSTASVEKASATVRRGLSLPARAQLASRHEKLALKVAHRMSGQCAEPFEDLSQLAKIGLLKAIERFDPMTGVAFSSFAVPYIRGEIQHFLRDHWQHLKVPRRTFETVAKVRKTQRQLGALGRTVPPEKIAAAMGMSESKWQWVSQATQRKPLANIDDHQHLAAANDDDDDSLEVDRIRTQLYAAIATLPRLQRECVVERYFEQLSEEAIAKRHRIALSAVHAAIEGAIAALKTNLETYERTHDC